MFVFMITFVHSGVVNQPSNLQHNRRETLLTLVFLDICLNLTQVQNYMSTSSHLACRIVSQCLSVVTASGCATLRMSRPKDRASCKCMACCASCSWNTYKTELETISKNHQTWITLTVYKEKT